MAMYTGWQRDYFHSTPCLVHPQFCSRTNETHPRRILVRSDRN